MEKCIDITTKDLYQFLISECRYGYTRNNNLMPNGAYEHVFKYLDEMYKVDSEMALITANQLIEECIFMELPKLPPILNDTFSQNASTKKFISTLLSFLKSHMYYNEPYNIKDYYRWVNSFSKDKKYNVYRELPDGKRILLSDEKIAYDEINDFIAERVLKTNDFIFKGNTKGKSEMEKYYRIEKPHAMTLVVKMEF